MQEPQIPGCWALEGRDNPISAPGIYSLCAVSGKSHMWVSPLLKQVSTTQLPQLWLCSSFVKGCRDLCQGWEMGIAIGRCWLLAWPEFQPHWSVSMVISWDVAQQTFALGSFLEGQTEADSQAMSLGRWGGNWGCFQWNGSASLGLCLAKLSGSYREVKAQLQLQKGAGQEWKANPGTAQWKELPLPDVSVKEFLIQMGCIEARDTARHALTEQPCRGCVGPPVELLGLGRLNQSSLSSEGGWGELQACPGHAGPKYSATEPSAVQLPSPLPPVLVVLLGLGMKKQEKGEFIFTSLNLSTFLPYLNWYKGIEIMMNWNAHFYWELSCLFLNGEERMDFWGQLSGVLVYSEAELHIYIRKRNWDVLTVVFCLKTNFSC